MPLIVRVAVAGKEFTDAGLMLQLPAPNVFGQLRVTVPVKLSCDVMESGSGRAVAASIDYGEGRGLGQNEVRVRRYVQGE